jgi:hypothetical protein
MIMTDSKTFSPDELEPNELGKCCTRCVLATGSKYKLIPLGET